MLDFVDRVCTGYSLLLLTQASDYRSPLNTVLADIQALGEYLEGYRARLGGWSGLSFL